MSGKKARAGKRIQPRKVYGFKAEARLPKRADPQAIGSRIDELKASSEDRIDAEAIVREARRVSSPLHKAFPAEAWDDTHAAHQYRLELARHLLRSITVEIVTPDRKTFVARGCVQVMADATRPASSGEYTDLASALSDPDQCAYLLQRALRELQAIKRKYSDLIELSEVFKAIDGVLVRAS